MFFGTSLYDVKLNYSHCDRQENLLHTQIIFVAAFKSKNKIEITSCINITTLTKPW